MAETIPGKPARLSWVGAANLPEAARAAIMGPGARFEIVIEDVLGVPTEVFAQRHRSLRESMLAARRNFADRTYLSTPDGDFTFAETARVVGHLAERFATRYGIGPGDRVAFAAANSAEYAMGAWATIVLGGIIVGLNGWWTSAELQYGIDLTEPKLVIADGPRTVRLAEVELGSTPLLSMETLLADLPDGPSELPTTPLAEDDPFLILFTSGTTGRPKGAVLSHRNFLHFSQSGLLSGAIGAVLTGVTPDPNAKQIASLMVGPLFHVSGIVPLVFTMDNGSKQVLPPAGRWSEITHFELTQQHGLQMWSGVPTQFWRLLQHPDFDKYDLSTVFAAGGGGANFPPDLVRLFQEKMPGISLRNGYGMSESAGMGTVTVGPMFLANPDAVGTANPATEIEIRDVEEGKVVEEGEVGEIYMRTAAIFLGYWNNEKATAEALVEGRWYRTGDFGRIVGGMLYLESRMRDLIIRAGENIYPLEIENRLIEHPDIDDVAVIGAPHQILGQEVMAIVVRRAGSEVTADEVKQFAAATLGAYKVPAHVIFRAELPYTQSGKVLKHELEKEYAPRV
ncbi:MAG: AMP-dependent synthetase and ligase [Ilumatobacteraceae bacterium]|nr:AMP-dependent synthetase and ligase [Ilumatobacteraceae bacterium]